jgi:glucosamine--fructose-6-phosphate aminotransferase (isomerizing)
MNGKLPRYAKFRLVQEMLETPQVVAGFDFTQAAQAVESVRATRSAFFTGEGSSRIFPAKNFISTALAQGAGLGVMTDGSRQSAEYDLSKLAVFGASNSGKTKEVVLLFRALMEAKHKHLFSLSAFADTPLGAASTGGAFVLSCGKEQAVAATKSVVEQGLFYHSILDRATGANKLPGQAKALAAKLRTALTLELDPQIVKKLAKADVLHWAGRNDGVAEELTLKTNEITRKRSAYLEGTYAVHGIEEVMSKGDAVIVVEPFKDEEEKFEQVLVKGIGCTVIAIASRKTRFPTIRIPSLAGLDGYIRLCAGWNLLVEIGLARKVDLDKTVRARKVGNELGAGRKR